MPTPAFSADSVSWEELRDRGVWAYCDQTARQQYAYQQDNNNELLRALTDSISQCSLQENKIAEAEEFLAKAEKRGSVLAPYLLLQFHYSREAYIPSNKFKQLFGLIRTQDINDDYFLDTEVKNKILPGLVELVYLFGEEILLGAGNEEKQGDNINAYMSIINTMFPSESSNCNTLLDDWLPEVQSALGELDTDHWLQEYLTGYKEVVSWVKDGVCPKFVAQIEEVKAKAKEKGIAIK